MTKVISENANQLSRFLDFLINNKLDEFTSEFIYFYHETNSHKKSFPQNEINFSLERKELENLFNWILHVQDLEMVSIPKYWRENKKSSYVRGKSFDLDLVKSLLIKFLFKSSLYFEFQNEVLIEILKTFEKVKSSFTQNTFDLKHDALDNIGNHDNTLKKDFQKNPYKVGEIKIPHRAREVFECIGKPGEIRVRESKGTLSSPEKNDSTNNNFSELIKTNEELTKINNDLDTFIFTAGHDLKAPIQNLEGLMTMLFDSVEVAPKNFKIVELMYSSIERLKSTLNDLTEISKIQIEENNHFETISFEEMLSETIFSIKEEIEISKATIESNFDVKEIQFSPKNLRSLIYNLVSNSIKYRSPDREPFVQISTIQYDKNFLMLKVSDNGLGMKSNNKDKIFGMFKRLHDHVDGSGLGLYIVKKIIENAGGKIEVESEVDKGTTFKIYLRLVARN